MVVLDLLIFGWDAALQLLYLTLDNSQHVAVGGKGRYLLELPTLFLMRADVSLEDGHFAADAVSV